MCAMSAIGDVSEEGGIRTQCHDLSSRREILWPFPSPTMSSARKRTQGYGRLFVFRDRLSRSQHDREEESARARCGPLVSTPAAVATPHTHTAHTRHAARTLRHYPTTPPPHHPDHHPVNSHTPPGRGGAPEGRPQAGLRVTPSTSSRRRRGGRSHPQVQGGGGGARPDKARLGGEPGRRLRPSG